MPRSFATPIRVGLILTIIFIVLGCEAVPSPAPQAPTFIPSQRATPTVFRFPTTAPIASPNVNSTPTRCGGFMWAYGTVSPEFITQVQDAMRIAGLEGSVKASTFGETNVCGTNYGARNVDYVFTVQVGSLETSEDIASMAAVVREIGQRLVDKSPAPYLGRVQLIFKSGELQCTWGYPDGAWEFFSVTAADGAGCRVPTNDRTRPLAAALTALSVDLACETFTMTAHTMYITLECERPGGTNHYRVNVTFALDRQGSAEACFHGWGALEKNLTGTDPVTVIQDGKAYYERERSFEWMAEGIMTFIWESIQGGPDVTFPPDPREKVYLRALKAGLIPGEGSDCR